MARYPHLNSPRTEESLSVSARRGEFVHTAHEEVHSSGLPQPMARIATAFKARGSGHYAFYTSQREAAVPHLSLPLPLVCSQL